MIEKSKRQLSVWQNGMEIARFPIALSKNAVGHKEREGDEKTPEGLYSVCIVKPEGKYHCSLGLTYPNEADARAAYEKGCIDEDTLGAILNRLRLGQRPPWGTPLGGEIYIHGGGTEGDWTKGCIALSDEDAEKLFGWRERIDRVEIIP